MAHLHFLTIINAILALTALSKAEDAANGTDTTPGGNNIGKFHGFAHGLSSGDVTILDDKTIEIKDFNYDGKGPAAWFALGHGEGYKNEHGKQEKLTAIADEAGSCEVVKKYETKTIKLTLPGALTVTEFNFLILYCFKFHHNFGYVVIPKGLTPPKGVANEHKPCDIPQFPDNPSSGHSLGPLTGALSHGVRSGDVSIVNEKTLRIDDFFYSDDNTAARFVFGRGEDYNREFSSFKYFIIVPNSNGSCAPLEKYEKQTVQLTLPGEAKIIDFDFVSVYSLLHDHNFGYVLIDKGIKAAAAAANELKVCERTEFPPVTHSSGNVTRDPHRYGQRQDKGSVPTSPPLPPPSSAPFLAGSFILTLGLFTSLHF